MLGDYYHIHTARACSNVTIHCMNRDRFQQLSTELSDFKYEIDNAIDYVSTTTDPIISFGFFRDERGSITLKEVFRLTTAKIMFINREMKASGIEGGIQYIMDKMKLNNEVNDEGSTPQHMSSTEKTHYILKKIEKKVDKSVSFDKYLDLTKGY